MNRDFSDDSSFFEQQIERYERMLEQAGQRLDEREHADHKPEDPAVETRRLARAALMNEFRRTTNPLRAAAITLALSELNKQDAS
jgi:hypothetical protein